MVWYGMVCMVDRGVELKEERVRHLEYFIGGGVICTNLETLLREIYVVLYLERGYWFEQRDKVKDGEERGKEKVCYDGISCFPPAAE